MLRGDAIHPAEAQKMTLEVLGRIKQNKTKNMLKNTKQPPLLPNSQVGTYTKDK